MGPVHPLFPITYISWTVTEAAGWMSYQGVVWGFIVLPHKL